MIPIFDSRDAAYKTPFGAVATGQEVRFTVALPKFFLLGEPVLKVFPIDDWAAAAVTLLTFQRADRLMNYYTGTFSTDRAAIYLYYFEFFSRGELLEIKRCEDGQGRIDSKGHPWQLTVYDAAMESPPFLRGGVLYQIFPDRFCGSGTPKDNVPTDRVLREDWGGLPVWRPNERGEVTNSDYFGGDLRGIREKLNYLQSLGVTALYLNPVFEAHSNHRYNTADYKNIDPLLGTNRDFEELTAAARERGISIILDGVFSHTGSDSLYFNREGRYGDGGAYRDPQSPYRAWYQFHHYPDEYESWWGFYTLPNVREQEPSYLDFICGERGVLRHWLDRGAAGYRLDVADELPDEFLDALHRCVKDYRPDAAIIGEVWEDASNKVSYGVRRRYLLGGQLDSVMNYPFKDAILDYVRYGNGDDFYSVVMQILENYPPPAIQGLMNSLSTHDTPRAITALAGRQVEGHDREWQERHHQLPEEDYRRGCSLFALASILQFGLPGIPCVYYGDEAGLCGYKDPFNRACYPWEKENRALLEHIRALGAVRRDHPVFAEAAFLPLVFSQELCSFERQRGEIRILFAVNRSDHHQRLCGPHDAHLLETAVVWGEYQSGVLGPLSGVVGLIRQ